MSVVTLVLWVVAVWFALVAGGLLVFGAVRARGRRRAEARTGSAAPTLPAPDPRDVVQLTAVELDATFIGLPVTVADPRDTVPPTGGVLSDVARYEPGDVVVLVAASPTYTCAAALLVDAPHVDLFFGGIALSVAPDCRVLVDATPTSHAAPSAP